MRVSAVQYHLHTIPSFEQFAKQVEHYIKTAQEFGAEFVLFPEFITTQLMSIGDGITIEELPTFTDAYRSLFSTLAKQTNMHIIGGTHVIKKEDRLYNVAHLFYPDGTIAEQAKLHITPTEVNEWNMHGGDSLHVFQTTKGTIAILTCYDIEFPEIVRMARAKGADVIFVRRVPMIATDSSRTLHMPCSCDRKSSIRRHDRDSRVVANR